MKTYRVDYEVDGVTCSTEIEAPDDFTALFIAGSQVNLTRSQRIRTSVLCLSTQSHGTSDTTSN